MPTDVQEIQRDVRKLEVEVRKPEDCFRELQDEAEELEEAVRELEDEVECLEEEFGELDGDAGEPGNAVGDSETRPRISCSLSRKPGSRRANSIPTSEAEGDVREVRPYLTIAIEPGVELGDRVTPIEDRSSSRSRSRT